MTSRISAAGAAATDAAATGAAAECDLLIAHADLVVPLVGPDLPGGWVSVSRGVVRALGSAGTEPPARRTLDASGCLVTPGLVNAHHHMYQSLNRALVVKRTFNGLVEWLNFYYPIWERLDEEGAYLSTWISLAGLALDGCTTSSDHLNIHPRRRLVDAQVAAARELGVRFHPTRGAMNLSHKDGRLPPDTVVESEDDILADCQRLVETYHDAGHGAMVRIALAPCNPFAVSHDLMRRAADLAEKLDVRLHTHLAESLDEEAFCLQQYGRRPMDRFDEVGWGSNRSWVAHSIFVNEHEIASLGKWGTGICHCPSRNLLGTGRIAPVARMKAAGVPVSLSTDSAPSLRAELAVSREANQRLHGTHISARELLEFATLGSARCLGRSGEIGQLSPGAAADIVVWPLSPSTQRATLEPDAVLEAWLADGPLAPRHTIIQGRFVVENGALINPNYLDRQRRHDAITADWQRFADSQ
jgi:cytosine/adenosine deaminase-related metal-dependent hydrolase